MKEQTVTDSDNWEHDGDHWMKLFYVSPEIAGRSKDEEPDIAMLFHVIFEENSAKIKETYSDLA